MLFNFTNLTLEVAQQAIKIYNSGCYGKGIKNPELDKNAQELFSKGLSKNYDGIEKQVKFIGINYGGVAGFKAAYSIIPMIAQSIYLIKNEFSDITRNALPIRNEIISEDAIIKIYAPFIYEIHGKKNWLVWASKFWHFLNPDAFPIFDSRVNEFFSIHKNRSAETYIFFCNRFKEFILSHQEWLPYLRDVDNGLSWTENKLWDKVFYGIKEINEQNKE